MNGSWSSEALDKMLSGPGGFDAEARESEEAREMQQLFCDLRENTRATAERHRSLAERSAIRVAASQQGKGLIWATALAAIAVCAAVPIERHHQHTAKAEQARLQEEAKRKQEADQRTDEALLTNIASDLSSSVAQPLQPLSVKFVSDTTSTTKGSTE